MKKTSSVSTPVSRQRIVLAGFLLALMGGFSYAWGVLVVPVMDRFGWSKAEATLPFTAFMVVFALAMVPAGSLQDRWGPRIVSAAGAALFLIAYVLAALVGYFPHAWWLVLSYGLIGGTACALTYACVAPSARKWFPDQPALAVSTAVMGFGLAALIVSPIKSEYLLVIHGIEGTFLIIGALTFVVSMIASRMLANPPPDWSPRGWTAPTGASRAGAGGREYAPGEVWRTPRFWMIWLAFGAVTSGGLMSIALLPAYGRSIGLTSAQAALAISVFAAFNGFGRPLGGFLADRFGVLRVMTATYAVQTVTLLAFPLAADSMPTLFVSAAVLGWGFAVTLGLFPVLTSACFGVRHLGGNYGLVFTAFGAGSLAPMLGAWSYDATGGYGPAFVTAGGLAGLGLVLCGYMMTRGTGGDEPPG
ncbi:MAG: OFA family MFS transporter [Pseudomonadota bacterium]